MQIKTEFENQASGYTHLDFALAYARQGWAVLPLHSINVDGRCTCGKPDCGSHGGKHPRIKRGVKAATTDEEQIRRWWTTWPHANIGIATGSTSDILVLDIDPRHGGDHELSQLLAAYESFPKTPQVKTGGDGAHYFFRMPSFAVKNMVDKSALRPGLEIKSTGGYVVAPPSNHLSGQQYHWEVSPREGALAELPEWFAGLLRDAQGKPKQPVRASSVNAPIPDGERNVTLTKIAGVLRRRGVSETEIFELLRKENAERCNPPLRDQEVAQIASSVARYAPNQAGSTSMYRNTDLGNAERFANRHAENIRHCTAWKKWLVWDGKRWVKDERAVTQQLAYETVRSIHAETATIVDDAQRQALAKHALASESDSRIKAMLSLAKALPGIPITPGELDTDVWLLNVSNGTVDLRAGKLIPHLHQNHITKLVDVSYDPEADCPTWTSFLYRIMDGNEGLIRFLQKSIGYALTGDVSEQVMFFCYGNTGKNGKSTFINTIKTLLGDYSQGMQPETLMAKQGHAINNDVARLQGVRFVAAIEGEEGQRLSESLIKQMTGGDVITARYLHQEFFDFTPTHKIFFASNHKPMVRGTDDAIWRRIRLIPFNVTIPEEERDNHLPEKLRNELPGILRWAVEGCLLWQREGLGVPPEVSDATNEYRDEMDIIAKFIDECCVVTPSAFVPVADMYAEYQEWCQENGERPWKNRVLANKLKERGFEQGHSGSVRRWTGIGLLADDEGRQHKAFGMDTVGRSNPGSIVLPFAKKSILDRVSECQSTHGKEDDWVEGIL